MSLSSLQISLKELLTLTTRERADMTVLSRILLGVTKAKVFVMVCKYRRLEGLQQITLHPPAAVIVTRRRRRNNDAEISHLRPPSWSYVEVSYGFNAMMDTMSRSIETLSTQEATNQPNTGLMWLLASNITRPVDSSRP